MFVETAVVSWKRTSLDKVDTICGESGVRKQIWEDK